MVFLVEACRKDFLPILAFFLLQNIESKDLVWRHPRPYDTVDTMTGQRTLTVPLGRTCLLLQGYLVSLAKLDHHAQEYCWHLTYKAHEGVDLGARNEALFSFHFANRVALLTASPTLLRVSIQAEAPELSWVVDPKPG